MKRLTRTKGLVISYEAVHRFTDYRSVRRIHLQGIPSTTVRLAVHKPRKNGINSARKAKDLGAGGSDPQVGKNATEKSRPLPHAFFHELKGIFDDLSTPALLESCNGQTQNDVSSEKFFT